MTDAELHALISLLNRAALSWIEQQWMQGLIARLQAGGTAPTDAECNALIGLLNRAPFSWIEQQWVQALIARLRTPARPADSPRAGEE